MLGIRSSLIKVAATTALLLLASEVMAATLRLTPASYDFGNVTVGNTASVNVFVDASVGADFLRTLDFDAAGTLTSGDFTITLGACNPQGGGPTGNPLSDGVGCTFSVAYTPTSAGAATATVLVSDYWAGAWGNMALLATGVAPPAATPTSVPGLSDWGVILLSGFLATVAVIGLRRS